MRILQVAVIEHGVIAKLECDADEVERLPEEQKLELLMRAYNKVSDALDEHEVDKQLKKLNKRDIPIQ